MAAKRALVRTVERNGTVLPPMSFTVADSAGGLDNPSVNLQASNIAELRNRALFALGYREGEVNFSIRFFIKDDPKTEIKDQNDLQLSTDLLAVVNVCNESQLERLENGKRLVETRKRENAARTLQRSKIPGTLSYTEMIYPESYKEIENFVDDARKRKVNVSEKSKHPEWFEGVAEKHKTKEDYMKSLGRSRASNISKRIKDGLEKHHNNALRQFPKLDAKQIAQRNKTIEEFLAKIRELLQEHAYFECYFDRGYCKERGSSATDCFCDEINGSFTCEGRYSSEAAKWLPCTEGHMINPYENLTSRLSFSIWELDHGIEVKNILSGIYTYLINQTRKTKVPTSPTFAGQTNAFSGSPESFLNVLFTKQNLRLVHKNCHVRTPHEPPVSDEDNRNP